MMVRKAGALRRAIDTDEAGEHGGGTVEDTARAEERAELRAALEALADDLRNRCEDGVYDVATVDHRDGFTLYGPLASTMPGTVGLVGSFDVRALHHGAVEVTWADESGAVRRSEECPCEVDAVLDTLAGDAWSLVQLETEPCHACDELVAVTSEGEYVRRGDAYFCDSDCLDTWADAMTTVAGVGAQLDRWAQGEHEEDPRVQLAAALLDDRAVPIPDGIVEHLLTWFADACADELGVAEHAGGSVVVLLRGGCS